MSKPLKNISQSSLYIFSITKCFLFTAMLFTMSFSTSLQAAPLILAETSPQMKTINFTTRQEMYSAVFQQAISDDLAGYPQSARKAYDLLQDTEFSTKITIPSAVNLVALSQFDAAKKAFTEIAMGKNVQEAQYANLWLLWLTARTWSGSSATLQKYLSTSAMKYPPSSPCHQAITDLYAGNGSVEAVFSAVRTSHGTSPLQQKDALTEATFFTGSYLQYVQHNNKEALQLYKREQTLLNSTSLESPLINQAAETLLALHH